MKYYVSAIKKVVMIDGYQWKDGEILVNTLTEVRWLVNDRLRTRLPIHFKLLEMFIFEIQRCYRDTQLYLKTLYTTLFLISYYGLFRIGELTWSQHTVKTKDVHIGENKDKILIILYSSKTHDIAQKPQKIKITAVRPQSLQFFCPFIETRKFL